MKNQPSFTTSAHAKCIIAGEHTVLRGKPAIVFPIFAKILKLSYFETASVSHENNFQNPFSDYLMNIVGKAVRIVQSQKVNVSFDQFIIENNIPIGAGIGFSAAASVVIGRWLTWMKLLKEEDFFSFCCEFENNFHGKSSGLDIAGSMNNSGIYYEIGHMHPLKINWTPNLFISYCGIPKNTKKAVQHVNEVREEQPELGEAVDKKMHQSVAMVEEALAMDQNGGLQLLIEAIGLANDCFASWGLIPTTMQDHIDWIKKNGALAVKPTGSGEGGYVLSLWDQNFNSKLLSEVEFIPVFSSENSQI